VTRDEVRAAAIDLLRTDYRFAKKAMVELEVFTRSRSKKAVYELRDFTDHLSFIFQDSIDADAAEAHLKEAKTHLRRCIVEPIEYLAEKQLVRVSRYSAWIIFRIPATTNPALRSGFYTKVIEAKQLIVQGRLEKTSSAAYDTFKQAFEIGTDLLAEVHPLQWGWKGFMSLMVVAGVLAAVTTAAVHYTRLLLEHPPSGTATTTTPPSPPAQ
jgi:hypothetical protein